MEGSTGTEVTKGIGVCNVTSDCYVIITDAGVAVKAGGKTFHITKAGGARFDCKVFVGGDVTIDGIVRARDFIKVTDVNDDPNEYENI